MKRVLLDQELAPNTAALLRAEGWDAVHVMEAGLERAAEGQAEIRVRKLPWR